MRTLWFIFLTIALSITAGSQSLWRGRSTESTVGIEFLRPRFSERNPEYTGIVTTLSGAIVVNPSTTLIVELPFVFSTYATPYVTYDYSTFGNPYFGVQFGSPQGEYFGEIGLRPPLTGSGNSLASAIATLSDIDRFEAYAPHIFQASGGLNIDTRIAPSLRFLARVGPSADFGTKGMGGTDLYADYGATLEIHQEEFSLGVGYSARMLLSESSIDDRTVDQLTIGGYYRISNFEPGLQGRFPLDGYLRRQVDVVYAMSIRLRL